MRKEKILFSFTLLHFADFERFDENWETVKGPKRVVAAATACLCRTSSISFVKGATKSSSSSLSLSGSLALTRCDLVFICIERCVCVDRVKLNRAVAALFHRRFRPYLCSCSGTGYGNRYRCVMCICTYFSDADRCVDMAYMLQFCIRYHGRYHLLLLWRIHTLCWLVLWFEHNEQRIG